MVLLVQNDSVAIRAGLVPVYDEEVLDVVAILACLAILAGLVD